jgi:hypothetical protein
MSTVLSTWASDDFVISRLTIKEALPQGAGELLSLVIVTVSAQIQSRLISRVLHYPQATIHYCTKVPVLYS